MGLRNEMIRCAQAAKGASRVAAELAAKQKNKILSKVAKEMLKQSQAIVRANQKDLAMARARRLTDAAMDRLTLTPDRIKHMAKAVLEVEKLSDPVCRELAAWKRPNGLRISKVSVPLGVILIIYESRPNVTSECASLCLKSGNAVILRGGKESFHSNLAIVRVYEKALRSCGIKASVVSLIQTSDRNAIDELLQLDELINLVIPRGGEALILRVAENSRIPVVKHYKGICHVYIDREADLEMAKKIAYNAKCQRPGVCNAMETLLVHRDIAEKVLPDLGRIYRNAKCEVRGDALTRKYIPWASKVTEKDWATEYLDLILSIRVVKNMEEAIDHITKYGSAHTDAIVTRNRMAAETFVLKVDSSSVMVNASTRFSDGNEYGFGAEIGISTDKVHARGPMGLEGLMSYKYVVRGNGQVRT